MCNPTSGAISPLQLNEVLTKLCNIQVIFDLIPTKENWLAAYCTYMNNKQQHLALHKRPHEPENEHDSRERRNPKIRIIICEQCQ